MDFTPREAIEAADALPNHPVHEYGLSNAPRHVLEDLVRQHRNSQGLFNDRREKIQPEAVKARLQGYQVKTRSRGGGYHEVHIDGEHVGDIEQVQDDDGGRAYMGTEYGHKSVMAREGTPVGGRTKAEAVRDMVPTRDARLSGGFTQAHREYRGW